MKNTITLAAVSILFFFGALFATSADADLPDTQSSQVQTATVWNQVSRDPFVVAWKAPDGLIWAALPYFITRDEAVETCEKIGWTLPSRENFELAEAEGIREAIPHMKDGNYWASLTDWPAIAWVFHGNSGTFGYDPSHGPGVNLSYYHNVLCVVR